MIAEIVIAALVLIEQTPDRGSARVAQPVSGCSMLARDQAWIERALGSWRVAERRVLQLSPSVLPTIVAIDAQCTWTGRPAADGRIVWNGVGHGPMVTFPNGNSAPLGPISFAAPDNGPANTGFFAMSLPSVWQAAGVRSGLGLERLMEGVLLHELSHTRQFYFANREMERLSTLYDLPADIGDDSLQQTFGRDPVYAADYQTERDLLFAAAAAPTNAEARRLAGEALTSLRARRSKWFAGPERKWAALDDLFLTMEGLGQWTAYAWFIDSEGAGLRPDLVLPEVRRGGRQWTQDEGLALFLTVDRLVPQWQSLVFAPKPILAEALLERASRSTAPENPSKRVPAAEIISVRP